MEDLWKKFKEETKEHIEKINEFLNELNEKSHFQEPLIINEKSQIFEQTQQVVLEDEKSKRISHVPRKKIYGKLKNLVKEIMEKENVSRAQAYRRAKKRFLENSQ